jgi:hypothetical protein
MMRYENAELELVKFLATDIIATSTEQPGQGGGMGGENEGEEDVLE